MANAHERFMQIAMEEACRGAAEGNVAVGSVVVHDEDMVARGRNLVATESDPTAHAETVALRNAGAAMGHTDFSGFTLYTTFEPCPMCCGAILASGVSTLVLGARFSDVSSQWGEYAWAAIRSGGLTGRAQRLLGHPDVRVALDDIGCGADRSGVVDVYRVDAHATLHPVDAPIESIPRRGPLGSVWSRGDSNRDPAAGLDSQAP